MRPDERDFDDELRGHLALSMRERMERGADPETARREALCELGYLPDVRESLRRVWGSRALEALHGVAQDVRVALRSIRHARILAAAIVVTLALGIGLNAAVVSVLGHVLLRPLPNGGEDRLVYIRQSAPGLGVSNLRFSVPEVEDLRSDAAAVGLFGDLSAVEFTLLGLGEPRVVRAGVVSGSYFEVMGLRPMLGRPLGPADDGPEAAGAAVLTHRFWATALGSDAGVIGRTIRLGPRDAVIVGVLQPAVPFPADTEILANVVTSPHHLEAVMVTERTHRMTELFVRLAAGTSIDGARARLAAAHAGMMRRHPQAYPAGADIQLSVTPLREQITAPARPVLFILMAAAITVFVIACANVANLTLAGSARREHELAVRAALGASTAALRRMLLAEGLVLCGAGAALGVLLAYPVMAAIARFVSRYSARALDVTMDATLLWIGCAFAVAAAVLLAFVPRLPSTRNGPDPARADGHPRVASGGAARLRGFAIVQVACSFVLVAGAGTLIAALHSIHSAPAGFDPHVLAVEIPPPATGVAGADVLGFVEEARRRIRQLPGVRGVAAGTFLPWGDDGSRLRFQFRTDGRAGGSAESPYGRLRIVSPGFFDTLGVPLLAGRDFTADDHSRSEPVVIVSERLSRRLFPDGEALHRRLWWTDPVLGKPIPRRIVGIAADVEDEHPAAEPGLTIYHPIGQMPFATRLFVRATGDAYALVPAVTEAIRQISPEQAVERVRTLRDVRADVVAPERLNTLLLSGFAAVALLIASVGIAGVLALSVKARVREFGVRLALGSTRRRLLMRILYEGTSLAAVGVATGVLAGLVVAGAARAHAEDLRLPGLLVLTGAAAVLVGATLAAALVPAARAARVDVLKALRTE